MKVILRNPRREVRSEHERVGEGVVVGEVMLGQENGVEAVGVRLEGLLGDGGDDTRVVVRAAGLRIDVEEEAHGS